MLILDQSQPFIIKVSPLQSIIRQSQPPRKKRYHICQMYHKMIIHKKYLVQMQDLSCLCFPCLFFIRLCFRREVEVLLVWIELVSTAPSIASENFIDMHKRKVCQRFKAQICSRSPILLSRFELQNAIVRNLNSGSTRGPRLSPGPSIL